MTDEVRLRIKPPAAARGYVDGAWWPRSHDPATEFPRARHGDGLMDRSGPAGGLSPRRLEHDQARTDRAGLVGHAGRPATLDANTVVVTGSNQRRMILLVVPPGTPGDTAQAVLRSASGSDTVASVKEILASNGVRFGRAGWAAPPHTDPWEGKETPT